MVRVYLNHLQEFSTNVKIFLAGNAIQAVGLSIYGLLFNIYLKELGFGESSIGSLISTTSLGISLMAIPAALIIEKFHMKHLVVTGMVLSSFFYFCQILHTDASSLFAFGLLASMFQALFNISISPFYLRNSTPQVRMHLFSMNSALSMLAQLVGYLIGGFLPDIIRFTNPELAKVEVYRSAIMVSLMIVFLSNVLFIRIKKVPIPKMKKPILADIKDRDWKLLSKLILPKLCFAFGGGLIVPFINLYLKEKFHFSTKMVGVSYAVLQFFIFAGIFITPTLAKKTTNLRFILITSLFSIPFMVTMGLTGNIGLVLSCFFIRGMLMNMSSPITSMFEMERVRETECVFASAIILFFYHLVYTSSTRIGGFMIEEYSFGPTFYVAAAFYGAAIILYHRFFKNEEVKAEVKEDSNIKKAA